MNRYLILRQSNKNRHPQYRGIERPDIPDAPADIKKAELLNQSIKKYFEGRDLSVSEGEYLKDHRLAIELANSFTLNNEIGDVFEVVQVVYPNESKPNHLFFLGYDVIGVNEHGSMIVDQLLRNSTQGKEHINIHQQLNENLLFEEINIAEEFVQHVKRKIGSEISLRIIELYT
jgi:hypothetical protein